MEARNENDTISRNVVAEIAGSEFPNSVCNSKCSSFVNLNNLIHYNVCIGLHIVVRDYYLNMFHSSDALKNF